MIYSLLKLDDLVCKTISNAVEEPIVFSINTFATGLVIDLTWLSTYSVAISLTYSEVWRLVTAKSIHTESLINILNEQ